MGQFIGNVETRWLSNEGPDRLMKLVTDFRYIDNKGQLWIAPAGSIVDGASIPIAFRWLIGNPMIGDYRNASVIHDVYCQMQTRPSKEVHRVFCEMLETLKLVPWKRKLMCFAVKTFGPRWLVPTSF